MFTPESGAIQLGNSADNERTEFNADKIDELFASLSRRLIENPKYRLPDSTQPFQTTIVVHGGAVFVKLIRSRDTTFDIDYLAAYTDALLEDKGPEDAAVLISDEMEREKDWGVIG